MRMSITDKDNALKCALTRGRDLTMSEFDSRGQNLLPPVVAANCDGRVAFWDARRRDARTRDAAHDAFYC